MTKGSGGDTPLIGEAATAAISYGGDAGDGLQAVGHYVVECFGPDGELKWREETPNTVVTVGKNDMENKYFSGATYTAAFYMGLISSTGYSAISAADTMSSHAGWTEDQNYTQGARPTAAFAAASAGAIALSAALTFSINATTTIKGCFLTTVATKGGTTGTLFSAGLFSGGDKAVGNGDTLNVSYSVTLT